MISVTQAAKHVYVVEKTKINLRSGPGYEFKIISLIHSGEELVVLDEFENWLKISVKNSDGTKVGWILNSLVKDEKPMTEQIASLKVSFKEVEAQLNKIKEDNLLLDKSKREIEKINQEQKIKLDEVNAKYMKLLNSYVIKWVIVGASILLIGIVIGAMYESMKYRHRPGIKL